MRIELLRKKILSRNNVKNSDTELVFYELVKFTVEEFNKIPEEPKPIIDKELLSAINRES